MKPPDNNRPFKVWEAYHKSYDELGRNVGTIGFFSKRYEAESIKKSDPITGMDEFWAVRSGGSVYVLDRTIHRIGCNDACRPIDLDLRNKKADAELRKEALKKLTPEDIRVLGVKSTDKL